MAGEITASPPAISATPLIATASRAGSPGGTTASYSRGRRKCIVPAKVKNPASRRCERVISRILSLPDRLIWVWTDAPLVTLKPNQLTIGHSYRLRIITRFIYGAEVIPGGSVGYDDVALLAIRDESTLPGGGGGGGGGGTGNNPGNGNAVFDGRNLFIKLECLGISKKGKCWDRATALKSKKGTRYTFPIQRVVNAKKGKVVRARVRFQFRSELERQRTVTLRSVSRPSRRSKDKTTRYTKLKLIKKG